MYPLIFIYLASINYMLIVCQEPSSKQELFSALSR